MNPINIIRKYYKKDSKAYKILVEHSKAVSKKAIEIAKRVPQLNPDLKFIEESAMLHDIGIFLTNAPKLGCFGKKPYVCHGYLGRKILEKEGYPKHALVCERHIGAGISAKEISEQELPLPKRDMIPNSIEEEIICFADKLFSKSRSLSDEISLDKIRKDLLRFGKNRVKRFDKWVKKFKY